MHNSSIPLEISLEDSVDSEDYEMVMDEHGATAASCAANMNDSPSPSSLLRESQPRTTTTTTLITPPGGDPSSSEPYDGGDEDEHALASSEGDATSESEYCIERLKEMLEQNTNNNQNNLIPPEETSEGGEAPSSMMEDSKTDVLQADDKAAFVESGTAAATPLFLSSDNLKRWGWWMVILMPLVVSFLFPSSGSATDQNRYSARASSTMSSSSSTTAGDAPSVVVQDLSSFVAHERASTTMDLPSIEDFPTDSFRRYAVAMCSSAASFEAAQRNLRLQLSVIPEEVASKIFDLVLVEGISQKNSIQDATSELGSDGQAQSYMAFWSSTFSPKSQDKKYETCFVLAGIAIKVADIIAGYKEETKNVIIGSEPCNCGYFYPCESCPVLTKVTAKTPVFKRHSLTLKQQDELHRWMTLHALKSAESMLATGSSANKSLPSDPLFNSNDEVVIQNLAWKKPSLDFEDLDDDSDLFD